MCLPSYIQTDEDTGYMANRESTREIKSSVQELSIKQTNSTECHEHVKFLLKRNIKSNRHMHILYNTCTLLCSLYRGRMCLHNHV